jgi:chorismate mutase-like protein
MTKLEDLRAQIDTIDQQLIAILRQRLTLVAEVGQYKAAHNLPPLDPVRWKAVVESRLAMAREAGVDEELVGAIFEQIHDVALRIEVTAGAKI